MGVRKERLELQPCICGGIASIAQHTAGLYQVFCVDCHRDAKAGALEEAICNWNEQALRPDSWEALADEFEDYFCRGWCNLYDERCEIPAECPIWGFRRRIEKLKEAD